MSPAESIPEAVVAVLVDEGQVLVVQRGPRTRRPGYWAPLSGRIEPGESQADAVVREVREEVGLDVTPVAKVWECETDEGTCRLHWWYARMHPGDLEPQPDEVSAVRWVDTDEFLRLEPTFAGDRQFFVHVLPTLTLA